MWLCDGLECVELKQTEWSNDSPVYGEQKQLHVLGWHGQMKDGHLIYIVKCDICSRDAELYKDGIFTSTKSSLLRGSYPCGCKKTGGHYTEDQFKILCKRALPAGFLFIGWSGEFIGNKTKVLIQCKSHGPLTVYSISNLLFRGDSCKQCKNESVTKPLNDSIKSFMDSGGFAEGTIFSKSLKLNTYNERPYWLVDCPECGETGESKAGSLREGRRPCACTKHKPKECYINYISKNDEIIAIKFGIAGNSARRVKAQNRKSIFDIVQGVVYTFSTVQECKAAERECKESLECGIVSKGEMSDGYSETTKLINFDKIVEIYKKFGGILKYNQPE